MKCNECKYHEAKLKCLVCEQADELNKQKHNPRYYSEVITPVKEIPFAVLEPQERVIWILYLANFTEAEIAHTIFVNQSTISRCLIRIKQKLTP